ncbi:TrmH family RNA methyltransferase [Haloimpatiens lingqiaonensis]|uniref:TrmH family RNA methyltransferase n=1 Tax=Haloimpatiens lingqiaonensis TaxID=1380675 RepID=UPI0010FDF17B|nr:RNA methyltransferase [Haloimpatiens lingqiaonensis]
MDIIKSKDNNIIKEVKKLKEKKYREEKESFLIEGFRFVEEALKSSFTVEQVFIVDKCMNKWEEMCKNLNLESKTAIVVSEQVLKLISNTDNPQGIIAVVKNQHMNISQREGMYLLADRIQDPGNMGTIIRTAHAVGALGVIVTKGTVDIYNDKTLRSTMGSIFNIPVIQDKDLTTVKELVNEGFKLVASYLDNESEDFYDVDLPSKGIFIVGNEGNGISEEIVNMSHMKVKIPMPGGAESLNASVAASIMMYEFLRQKRK